MRSMVWTCDRCGTRVEVPQEVIIVDYYSPAALRRDPSEWSHGLPDWQGFADDETVTDVCPNCVTAGERADRVLREVAAPFMFGEVDSTDEAA